MPTLKKPVKQKNRSINDEERKKIYATTKWRKLRLAHLMKHPLCERCEKAGKVVPAEDCHHKISFMTGKTPLDRKALAFDPDNLESLCKECHALEHSQNYRA